MAKLKTTLFLILHLSLINAISARFSCPSNMQCYCYATGIEDEFKIHCNTNTTTTSSFDTTILLDAQVRVQCKNKPDWSSFLLGSSINLGNVKKFVFSLCSPAGNYSERIINQLNMTGVEILKYEGLQSELSPDDFDAFPDVKYLVLSNNYVGKVPSDLLRGLPNLRQLELRKTNIEIPDGFFSNAGSLRSLELSGNSLEALKPGVFDGLKKLELLNLWQNHFRNLEPGVFRNLSSLISLDIHQNNLQTLPINIFQNLKNLEVINFSSNNFTSLPSGIFKHNPKLKIVKLLFNKVNLTELPSRFFADLDDLKVVSLMRSGLLRLPEDLFWGSTSLTEVNLNRNYLTSLPENFLKDAFELHTLSMSFNDLAEIPDNFFSSTKKLIKLDLSKNQLETINDNSFVGLDSLEELNMENNNLKYIKVNAFFSLGELKIANFANNKLTLQTSLVDIFGRVSPFHPCASLEELYLAHNNISEMFSDWVISDTRLRKLDLSYNSFEFLATEDLQFMSNSVTVDLRNNAIKQIDLKRLEYISKESSMNSKSSRNITVNLNENPIQCDCEAYPLLRYVNDEMLHAFSYVRLNLDDLVCDGPEYLSGVPLSELSSSRLKCLVENEPGLPSDPCSSDAVCECWHRPSDNTLLLDCSDRNLTSAPEWFDYGEVNRVEIDLSMNQLTEAPNLRGVGFEKVRSLNLAKNHISFIEESLIAPNLQFLNLEDNNLTYIDTMVLKRLFNSSQMSKLILHNNPWRCDCNSRNLLSFVKSKFRDIPDLVNVTCRNSSIPIVDMNLDEICPMFNRLLIIFCTCISLFGLLVGSLAALYFRYQQQIKVWLYAKNMCMCLVTEDEIDKDKTYDAFISYSHKDEQFVVKQLMNKLEEGPKPFKLCVHTRDWIAGDWIPSQIARSVEESKRTIVVLSPNFMESVWGRLEFQTAHKQALSERRARVIVILYGDIEPKAITDPELKAYLEMNTYVKWGEPAFWQKLRYAMPHSIRNKNIIFSNNYCKDNWCLTV